MRIEKFKHTAQPLAPTKRKEKAKGDVVKVSASKVTGIARIVPAVHAFQKTAPSKKLAEIISKVFFRILPQAQSQSMAGKKNRR